MTKEIFERVLNIIKKTGDRVIIVNPDSGFSYVLMTLSDYEKMVGGAGQIDLTVSKAQDKINRINRDIAIWREEENKKIYVPPVSGGEEIKNEETESQFYFEPVE